MSGWPTTQASSRQGISKSAAEMVVQLRPPKTGTAKVYGSRRKAPTPLGTATRHRAWLAVECPAGRGGKCPMSAGGHLDDHDAPQHPHAEPDVLGEDREDQVATSDRPCRSSPRTWDLRAASRRSSVVPHDARAVARAASTGVVMVVIGRAPLSTRRVHPKPGRPRTSRRVH